MAPKVVAVASGGIDSTSYMAVWRYERHAEIHPLIFNYGQKGQKEVQVGVELCRKLSVLEPIVVDIGFMRQLWKGTQLTDERVEVKAEYEPTVVVPLRNAVFLTIATAYAYTIGAEYVIYGSHTDDIQPRSRNDPQPLYPDCTPQFQEALETALHLGHFRNARKVEIWSPAREGLTKAENLKRAFKHLNTLIYKTWSCYRSEEVHCGQCESCKNRHRAFIAAGIPDKTAYKVHPIILSKCLLGKCGL